MAKCTKCTKLETKKNPGVQYSGCSKWFHGVCASITNDQLNTLSSMDSIDWKCRNCAGNTKPRRLSCILPDAEEEDNTDTELNSNSVTHQILSDVRREVRDIIQQELQTTLQFYSDKIDEYEDKVYKSQAKSLENKYFDFKNTYQNLELKNEVLEQKINMREQSQITNKIEICGLTEKPNENITEVLTELCYKIGLDSSDMKQIYRKKNVRGTSKNLPPIVMTLLDGCREKWLEISKNSKLTTHDLGLDNENKIYLRECLTPATAYLLWKAKNELKNSDIVKFVWYKNGMIIVRKNENDKKHSL
ncbi:LOW QUALITY PROTEIN: uncharacterized protein ACR2FA_008207 [Aphomia sociella]